MVLTFVYYTKLVVCYNFEIIMIRQLPNIYMISNYIIIFSNNKKYQTLN